MATIGESYEIDWDNLSYDEFHDILDDISENTLMNYMLYSKNRENNNGNRKKIVKSSNA